MLCSPWLVPGDVTLCSLDTDSTPGVSQAETDRATRAILVASSLLYAATGRQFPGICTDLIRPCASGGIGGGQPIDYPPNIGGSRVPLATVQGGCCGCLTVVDCDGRSWPAVDLPHRPVVDVPEILIDGVPFAAFHIVDDRYLIRDDGGNWPQANNLTAATTEVGTWSIEYRWGSAPTPDLVAAAEILVCEFLASWCVGGAAAGCPDCHLPQRLTSLTYEGATVAALDPFTFLGQGGFGIPSVDYAVRAANPFNLPRTGRVVTPRDLCNQGRRVRGPGGTAPAISGLDGGFGDVYPSTIYDGGTGDTYPADVVDGGTG